jgi:hypothetical protein
MGVEEASGAGRTPDQRQIVGIRHLHQCPEVWECSGRTARWWITPPGKPARRPNVILTVVADTGRVARVEFDDDPLPTPKPRGLALPAPLPTPEQVFAGLLQAMRRPAAGAGSARRPTLVYLDRPELVEALAPRLAELEVRGEYRRALPTIEATLQRIQARNDRRGPIPGLLTLAGITVPLVAHLCELAADYYRQAPWQYLTDREPFEIRYPPDGPPRYAIAMGSGGEVFGLAVYDALEQMRRLLAAPESKALGQAMTYSALFFEEAIAMAFDDLETMETYGLALTGEHAYPVVGRTTRTGTISTPLPSDVFWLEGALAAVLAYVRDHMRFRRTGLSPAKLTLPVHTISGEKLVSLQVPVR